ncbi:unnamed protein product [Laminaria digitata]
MGKTSKEGGGEQGFEADGRVYGGRGMVEMVRKTREYQEGERIAAPFYRFVKQAPEITCFSDASYEAIGGLCLETEVYWRYQLTEEVRKRTVRSKRGKGDWI